MNKVKKQHVKRFTPPIWQKKMREIGKE